MKVGCALETERKEWRHQINCSGNVQSQILIFRRKITTFKRWTTRDFVLGSKHEVKETLRLESPKDTVSNNSQRFAR